MLWLAPTSSGCHSLLIDRDTALKMLSVAATKPRLLGKDKKKKKKTDG